MSFGDREATNVAGDDLGCFQLANFHVYTTNACLPIFRIIYIAVSSMYHA